VLPFRACARFSFDMGKGLREVLNDNVEKEVQRSKHWPPALFE